MLPRSMSLPEEADLVDELPNFEANLDEPEFDGPLDEAAGFIEPLDEHDARDRDDSNSYELDVGIDLHQPIDDGADKAASDIVLDIGELLDHSEEQRRSNPEDDEPGPPELDISAGIQELPDGASGSSEEGTTDSFDDLVNEELPNIDADEEGDLDDTVAGMWMPLDAARDEELPPWSQKPWRECALEFATEPLCALALMHDAAVAGGRDLLWVHAEHRTLLRLGVEGGTVTSLAVTGMPPSTVLYATALGRLMRRQSTSAAEACDNWREAAGIARSMPTLIELCQPNPKTPELLLARSANGELLRSGDVGSNWQRVDLGGKVRVLSKAATPALAIVEKASSLFLFRSSDGGLTWQELELDDSARAIAEGDNPKLAGHARLVAIADEGRGLAMSRDGGAHFVHVTGCANATALAVGSCENKELVWASLFEEAHDRSWLVRIDAEYAAAERIAEMKGRGASETLEESAEVARVAALGWDPATLTLWAAGGFGLTSWSLPKSSLA